MKKNIFALTVLLATIASFIMFWGSLIIWVTTITSITANIYYCFKGKSSRRWYWEEVKENPLFWISVGISALSTIIQFRSSIKTAFNWFIDAMTGIFSGLIKVLSLEIYGIGVWVFVTLILSIFLGYKYTMKKIAQRKEKRLAEEKELLLKKELVEKEKKAEELLKKVSSQEKISWKDLYEIYHKGNYFSKKIEIPEGLILKTEFMEVVEVSKIKTQLFYEQSYVDFALKNLNRILEGSNDTLIQQVIDQIKKLEEFKNYKGYKKLVESRLNYRYYLIRDLVKLELTVQ